MFKLDKRVIIALGLYVLWVGYYTVDSYRDNRVAMMQNIDRTLLNGAMNLPIMLPEDFHRQEMIADSVTGHIQAASAPATFKLQVHHTPL